jgi:hypothetical protein
MIRFSLHFIIFGQIFQLLGSNFDDFNDFSFNNSFKYIHSHTILNLGDAKRAIRTVEAKRQEKGGRVGNPGDKDGGRDEGASCHSVRQIRRQHSSGDGGG